MTVQRWVALTRTVRDLAASLAFYRDGLGFCFEDDGRDGALGNEDSIAIVLGSDRIVLRRATRVVESSAPVACNDLRFQHFAIVTRDMDGAYARLQRLAPAPISEGGPQQLPQASGGVRAFKFRDPDGHPIELIEFPDGADPPRWSAMPLQSGVTLGIDHTAISVADADRSIAFYEQQGFRVASRQTNRGSAQARLDGLATRSGGPLESAETVVVDVVALAPRDPDSAHLELLCYLRPPPVNEAQAQEAEREVVEGADCVAWCRRDLLPARVADPDGHRVEFLS